MLDLDVTHELVVVPYVHGFVVLYCIVLVHTVPYDYKQGQVTAFL